MTVRERKKNTNREKMGSREWIEKIRETIKLMREESTNWLEKRRGSMGITSFMIRTRRLGKWSMLWNM